MILIGCNITIIYFCCLVATYGSIIYLILLHTVAFVQHQLLIHSPTTYHISAYGLFPTLHYTNIFFFSILPTHFGLPSCYLCSVLYHMYGIDVIPWFSVYLYAHYNSLRSHYENHPQAGCECYIASPAENIIFQSRYMPHELSVIIKA